MANIVYQWNPFQQNINNRITAETIKTADFATGRVEFVPRAAPFFSRNFQLFRQGSADPLILGYDYCFAHPFDKFIGGYIQENGAAVPGYNRNVFGSIIMLRPQAGDVLLPKYDTIGSPFTLDEVAFAELVANIVNSPRVADWADLDPVTIPVDFPADPHDHPVDQTYDYEEMMTQLKSLILAVTDNSQSVTLKSLLEEHISLPLIEAHLAAKSDIGLPLTPNMAAAEKEDLLGNSANLIVTVDVLKEAFRLLATGNLNLGAGNTGGGGSGTGGGGGGSSPGTITIIDANTTLSATLAGVVIIDASGSDLDIVLPASNGTLGVTDFIVRRKDNTGNTLKVSASGTDKIKFHTHLRPEGYSFLLLMGAGDYWHLRSDATGGWIPISRYDNTPLGHPVMETTTAFNPGGYGPVSGPILQRVDLPWLWDHAQQSGMLVDESARVGMEGGWTRGDGVSTFRGPELRAEFMRVLDESRGVDTNRVAGSWQKGSLLSGNETTDNQVHSFYNVAVSRAGLGWDTPVMSKYSGYSAFVEGANQSPGLFDISHYGVSRPRSIAYPGRIKMI